MSSLASLWRSVCVATPATPFAITSDCDPYALAIAALHTNRLLKDRS